ELSLENHITALNAAVERRTHPTQHRMADFTLDVGDHPSGIGLVPSPVQIFSRHPELDQEVAGQILRLDLAALFAPKADQARLVIPHNDPRIETADEVTAYVVWTCRRHRLHGSFSSKMGRFSLARMWH